jgi:hypothetical protein
VEVTGDVRVSVGTEVGVLDRIGTHLHACSFATSGLEQRFFFPQCFSRPAFSKNLVEMMMRQTFRTSICPQLIEGANHSSSSSSWHSVRPRNRVWFLRHFEISFGHKNFKTDRS